MRSEETLRTLRQRVITAARRWVPADVAEDLTQKTILVLTTDPKCINIPDSELVYAGIAILSNKVLEWKRATWKEAEWKRAQVHRPVVVNPSFDLAPGLCTEPGT